jgi:CheY-like chemotaxis protein
MDAKSAAFPRLAVETFPQVALPPRNALFRRRVVLAHSEAVYAALAGRHLRRHGWEVHLVGTGLEARHLARVLAPAVIVLGARLPDESGWLTCNKLVRDYPGLKVVLVGAHPTPEQHRFAAFAGAAALVSQDEGVQALIDEVHDTALPAAG